MNAKFKSNVPELAAASLFWGMYSRLARKLKVTPQHVRQVARGISSSKRVSAAIEREVRRLNAKQMGRAA